MSRGQRYMLRLADRGRQVPILTREWDGEEIQCFCYSPPAEHTKEKETSMQSRARRGAIVMGPSLVGSVIVACVLSLGVLRPDLVSAGQARVDICHRARNGTYSPMTIAEPAYRAHIAHGDAKIGDLVPGGSGAVFDEACNPVPPCGGFFNTPPNGSYRLTCFNCGVSECVLSCNCEDVFGDVDPNNPTSLDLTGCDPTQDITNDNSHLTCTP